MKVVAISQRIDFMPERNEKRDGLDQRLITFMLVAGFLPIPIPNQLCLILPDGSLDKTALDKWLAKFKPDALVLSGGNDIGQSIERDLTEGWLLTHAKKYNIPVLGICRGMQMMASWSGAKLIPVDGHIRKRHNLYGEINHNVNSYHNFTVSECPEKYKILARSEDGMIEAIGHMFLPWEGWMWHPEREADFSDYDIQRLKIIFK